LYENVGRLGHALTVHSGSGSNLVASSGNVNFNGTNSGSVTIQPTSGSTPLGSISANGGAGNVNLNIGSGTATVSANSISGIVQDPNANFNAPTSGNVSITVNTGSLTLGNFAAAAGNSISAITNASNGNITTAGNLRAGTNVNLTTSNLTNNNAITATTGNVVVQSNGINNVLIVNFGNNATMTATAGNVDFNNATPGQITISGGPGNYGTISANNAIILNAGSSSVNVSVNKLIGCIEPTASSVSIQTQAGGLDFCNGINTSSNSGPGGSITIIANGGAINISTLTSNGSGSGNNAGSISLTASNGITFVNINANGSGGAGGGTITITSNGQAITGNYISSTGTGGNGGSITTSSNTLVLNGVDSSGNSINTSDISTGNGGAVSITTTSPLVFTVGGGGNLTGNGTAGNINANGVKGGSIALTNYGNSITGNQVINGSITANGTTGNGGSILFQAQQPAGSFPLITTINGGALVQATNAADDSGLIGFNAGAGEDITLDGAGTVHAGAAVRLGALNPSTLALLNTSGGTILINKSLTIGNAIETNGFIPPSPSAPTAEDTSSKPALAIIASNAFSSIIPIPSLTATDQTQIFGFINFNIQEDEESDDVLANNQDASEDKGLIAGTTVSAFRFGADEINRLAKDGVILTSDSGHNCFNLEHGNILLTPDTDILISTNHGKIFIGAKATVFIMKSNHDVVVYDMVQTKPNQVSVVINRQRLAMEPGNMLALSNQNIQRLSDMEIDCRSITHHRAQLINLKNNTKAFRANFSIASAMTNIQPLRRLTYSPYKKDKSTLDKLWKNAQIQTDFFGVRTTAIPECGYGPVMP